MKAAKLLAVGIEVWCPHCQATKPDPDVGSLFWTIDRLRACDGETVACGTCEKRFTIRVKATATIP